MTRLAVAGVILALALAPGAALSQNDSRVGAPPMPNGPMPSGPMPMPPPPMVRPMPPQGMPPMMQHGPVAMHDIYRQPRYGSMLPRQWVSASYFIPNYSQYRLPRPAAGFGWSRYYDDVVLTDRFGRVYDWRGNVNWRRHGHRDRDYGYRDGGPPRPHWFPADAEGRYPWMEGPTITTTTVTQGKPIETKTVRYVTEYVTVPARRTKYVKRSKYVRL
jgi:hypothetical protein